MGDEAASDDLRRAQNLAAQAAYEDAALQGLCEEGRLEAASVAREQIRQEQKFKPA